ncbi:MAG: F0F1 ATP synthase subunit A [Ruminococcaceae bacterium]|nr:F0F1 ATP synthase subunit A [Oscillospiraceae bacterium]
MGFVINIGASALVFVLLLILKASLAHKRREEPGNKKLKTKNRLYFWGMVIAAWYFVACVINEIRGGLTGIHVEVELFAPRVELFGISFSESNITMWIITAAILVLCLLFRFIVFPKFTENPKGLQNIAEIAVEEADKFVKGVVGEHLPGDISAYMVSIALFMIGSALSELFGKRPPTADLIVTASMGLCTFFLINYYGIRVKGIGGRLKSLASPSPVIFPMKVLSDVAVPVSLACRLFGNMLGGMIVMHLLQNSLGGYSVGVTSLAGLYFNLFHPLIQTYIFITLSLTFINEAAE